MRTSIGRLLPTFVLAATVALATAAPARGQSTAPPVPALLARHGDEAAAPLALRRMAVNVTIAGFLARTHTTLTFHNPHPRVLEGELVFPLPEGATISGYALDVGGEMVEGVVVARDEARVAFETEVRGRVDPGLVEWVRGNNFRTRVWPIPAGGTRTVRIEYVSELAREGHEAGGADVYHLPLRQPRPLDDLQLRVEVVTSGAAPEVRESAGDLRFEAWDRRFVAETTMRDVAPSRDLHVALPKAAREPLLVETSPDGTHHFVLEDVPPSPAAPAVPAPGRVGLLWDASLSRAAADRRRETALVRRWLSRLRDVEVLLTVFRNVPEAPRAFRIAGGGSTALVRALEQAPCDGGTDLGALDLKADVAYFVLVSDGLATLGSSLPIGPVPVYAVSADAQSDHAALRHLAESSGGRYLNLARVPEDEALSVLGVPVFSLLSVTAEPGTAGDLVPSVPRPVDVRMTIAGRLLADEARLTLRYGGTGLPTTERVVTVRREGARAGRLAARYWAQRRVEELVVFPERHRAELLEIGRQFTIVTPGTSLLVLETLEQHLRHGIEPPASRAALREQYRARVAQRTTDEARRKQAKLERVVGEWEAAVAWWEQEFRPRPRKRMGRALPLELGVDGGVPGGIEGGEAGGVAGGVPGGVVGALADGVAADPARMSAPPPPAGLRLGDGASPSRPSEPEIRLRPWDPAVPYLAVLKRAGANAYAAYIAERRTYGDRPSFYLDCADHLLRRGRRALAVRVLTGVLELKLEDARLIRVAAHRLRQIQEHDHAIELFERVLRMRPEEPQSLRDLALALEGRADARRAAGSSRRPGIAADYRRALELLDRLVRTDWDVRFAGLETIALMEANRILAVAEREGLALGPVRLDPRLRRLLDVDVRIVLTWDTDLTDMDLWVTEPSGETCYYGGRLTMHGGRMSDDFTGGYGPEEYAIRRAPAGEYHVQANFYGSRAAALTGPTTLQATLVTDYGRPAEKRRSITLRLGEESETFDLGSVVFTPTGVPRAGARGSEGGRAADRGTAASSGRSRTGIAP